LLLVKCIITYQYTILNVEVSKVLGSHVL